MKKRYTDIRKEIITPIILIMSVGTILILLLTLYLMEKQTHDRLNKDFQHVKYVAEEEFAAVERYLKTEASNLSIDPTILESMARKDRRSLTKRLSVIKHVHNIDIIKAFDEESNNLVQLGSNASFNEELISNDLAFRSSDLTLIRFKDEIWMIATKAVSQNSRSIGFIMIGNKVSEAFLGVIGKKAKAEIAFEYNGRIIGSSPAAVEAVSTSGSGKQNPRYRSIESFIADMSGTPYVVHCITPKINSNSKAHIYALIQTHDSLTAKKNNTSTIFLVSVAVLTISIIVTYRVSYNIAKPLIVMSKKARKIAKGDYKQIINHTGIREIDELATSFNIMGEALEAERQKLELKAYTDNLTDLYNHRYFHDSLSGEINRAHRYQYRLSLIIIDIDNFKIINDTYGHQKGDAALRLLADRIKISIRETDIACRIGGEEFAIILPMTSASEAFSIAERLRLDVLSQSIEDIGIITVSLGIAAFPDHTNEKDTLIKSADIAMYQAKKRGKNCALTYNSDMAKKGQSKRGKPKSA